MYICGMEVKTVNIMSKLSQTSSREGGERRGRGEGGARVPEGEAQQANSKKICVMHINCCMLCLRPTFPNCKCKKIWFGFFIHFLRKTLPSARIETS